MCSTSRRWKNVDRIRGRVSNEQAPCDESKVVGCITQSRISEGSDQVYCILLVVTYEGESQACWATTSHIQPVENQSTWDLHCDNALCTYQLSPFGSMSFSLVCSDLQYKKRSTVESHTPIYRACG
jgi:hypothetical protein